MTALPLRSFSWGSAPGPRACAAGAKGASPFGIPSPPAGGTGALGFCRFLPLYGQPAMMAAGWPVSFFGI
ncbi:hypothetical protein D7X33_04740 [Butyricicoccus sp. 1XD8-22]|nr:hypothetical protein D7X33_04740 [Butyricicoccus sp. 1XD8-22]